jgi:16S rRNA (guanine527-N7)-methyltransferase
VRDARLELWLDAVLATPGLTAIRDRAEAARVLLDDALAGVPLVGRFAGPVVDVGSGGGTPGIPLAAALPHREVTLLEAQERKAAFLQRAAGDFPNAHVVRGRAEEQPLEGWGVAVAKALAPPPVAAEWCLPLVGVGGGVVLWVGPTADAGSVAKVAARLGGEPDDAPPGFLVLRKVTSTPPGFPRRAGVARKRPLA